MKKQKETISFVLWKSNLSSNPDYYLGRSIEYNDITPEVLLNVSNNIKTYIGSKEQEVFNQMVLDLPTLKGQFFIEFTTRLQIIGLQDGWWWDKSLVKYYNNKEMPICEKTERIKEKFKKLITQWKN